MMRLGNTYEGINSPHKPDVETNLISYNPENFIIDRSNHENRLVPTIITWYDPSECLWKQKRDICASIRF